jgi:hypothetical protein
LSHPPIILFLSNGIKEEDITMIHLVSERKTIVDLDELTEDQWADIDRLLMIVWKTNPVICFVNRDILEDRQCTDEPEESLSFYFLCVSGL